MSSPEIHNGVICRECFRTIDLTDLAEKQKGQKGFGLPISPAPILGDSVYVKCPHCGQTKSYLYSEVGPLEADAKIKELTSHLRTLAKELERYKQAEDAFPDLRKFMHPESEPAKQEKKQRGPYG